MSSFICRVCHRGVRTYMHYLSCSNCSCKYHINCIDPAVNRWDHSSMSIVGWCCPGCSTDMFPFYNLDNDEFTQLIIELKTGTKYDLSILNDMVFVPFELNDESLNIPMIDIDPDVQFFNAQNIIFENNSNYYLEDTFNALMTDNPSLSRSLSLFHLNIHSIPANLQSLEQYIESLNHVWSVIGISETWLNEYNSELYNIKGYNHVSNPRKDRCGGGVSLFINDTIPFDSRNDLMPFSGGTESLFIEVIIPNASTKKPIIIGVIYRPPDIDTNQFNNELNDLLSVISRERKICYIMGDYNVNLLNYENHNPTLEHVNILNSQGFLPLINRPTRVTAKTATLIDNIYTNNYQNTNIHHQGIFYTDISDHFPIFHINEEIQDNSIDTCYMKRTMNPHNFETFSRLISLLDFSPIYEIEDVNAAYNALLDMLKKAFNQAFPFKKVKKLYYTRKPYITPALQASIKVKNKLHTRFLIHPICYHETSYKQYRNKLNHLIRIREKQYYEEKFEEYKSNMRKSWDLIKQIINKNKTKTINKTFIVNNELISDDNKVVNSFNKYFVNVGKTLAENIEPTEKNPLSYLRDKNSYRGSLFLDPVLPEEISKLIKLLKNSTPGFDDLPSSAIKAVEQFIVEPLAHIFNLSFLTGIVPNQTKIANVVPIFKGGNKQIFSNYRPVSILPVLSKLLEKLMYTRILNYLNSNSILYNYQFGFRQNHSTYMALIILYEKIVEALDRGDYVLGLYLDFSKAFDTVDHSILLTKLEHYGVRGVANLWCESYLKDRLQHTTYNNTKSANLPITCGVPQGSILGPLLFLIYVNDLALVSNKVFTLLFADDTNIFYSSKTLEDIEYTINHELVKISNWLKANKLSLNIKKTHYMIFTRKNNLAKENFPTIKLEGTDIDYTTHTKFLGVIIDHKLNWKQHIDYISQKIAKGIGIISKARSVLSKQTLLSLYYSFVYPYISYCNIVWGNTYKTNLMKLVMLQKRIVRIISGVSKRTSTHDLFYDLHIIKLIDLYEYSMGLFMYKFNRNELPGIFTSMFEFNYNIHLHNTRQSSNLHVIKPKSNMSKMAPSYAGAVVWNNLFLQFPTECTLYLFKKQLKQYIISQYGA